MPFATTLPRADVAAPSTADAAPPAGPRPAAAAPDRGTRHRFPAPGPAHVPIDEQVRAWVSESFPAIQAAWSSGSADRLEPYLSARLSDHLAQQLAALRRDGVVNRVEDPRLLEVGVLPRRSTDPVVEVAFAARDWLADVRTGAVLDGDPHRDALFRQHWHLLRGGPTGWLLDRVLPA